MLHGIDEAQNAEKSAKEAFSGNINSANLPSIDLDKKKLNSKLTIIDIVLLSKLEKSKSEIRRLIKSNGIKINNEVLNDENFIIDLKNYENNSFKLSIGKKDILKINFV